MGEILYTSLQATGCTMLILLFLAYLISGFLFSGWLLFEYKWWVGCLSFPLYIFTLGVLVQLVNTVIT